MPTPTVINKYRYSDSINRREWDSKYFFEPFNINPVCSNVAGGAAAGAISEVDAIWTGYSSFEQYNIVANTNISPKLDAISGYNIAAGAVNTNGTQYDTGIAVNAAGVPLSNYAFKIDTSGATTPAFFVKAQFTVTTVLHTNPCIVGFREVEARNQVYTNDTDFASIGIVGAGAAIQTISNRAAAGAVTTPYTVAGTLAVNATQFQVAVLVDSFGNATFYYNGVLDTNPNLIAYQFVNGIYVAPYIVTTQIAGGTAISCNYWECGFQS